MRYTILVMFLSLTTINCNKSGSSPEPFPVPTGNYTVAVAYRSFIRPASSVKAEDRPLGISIWYPISGVSSYRQAPYCVDSTLIWALKKERNGLWREITGRSKSGSIIVGIEGMMHFDFTDLPFIIPDNVRIKNGGTLPALRGHQLMSRLRLAFLGVHLQNKDPEDLGNVIANNKGIEFEFNDGR